MEQKPAQAAGQFMSLATEHITDQEIRYAEFVDSRAKKLHNPVLDALHAAVGLAGEGGELLDAVKKCWIYNKPLSPEVVANFKEECGDALFYIQMICNQLGISINDLINENIEKLCKRYPYGYTDEAALVRADKQ